jgi:hypothetical protein
MDMNWMKARRTFATNLRTLLMSILDVHPRSLAKSTALSVYYMPAAITPIQVIRLLNTAGIRFVLVGAHGLGGWIRAPRATEDVDVIVAARGVRKAVRELLAAFPQLEADDNEVATRLRDRETKDIAIDVMKPNQHLMQAALKNTCEVELEGEKYHIPTLEMALALKFATMINLNRPARKKHQDAHDFIAMVEANPEIDLAKLAELGELVYSGGGAELIQMVGQARRGETLTL